MVMNTPEMMEPILPGQGTITPDQEQRDNVISQLWHNGNTI